MSQAKHTTTAEQLVSETGHVQLSRLLTEHAWRVDNGRADMMHELYINDGELNLAVGNGARTRRSTRVGPAARRGYAVAFHPPRVWEQCASWWTVPTRPMGRPC